MSGETATRNPQQQDVSLHELIGVLAGHWRLIVSLSLLVTVAAAAVAVLMRPVYLAEVLLAPAEEAQGAGALGSIASQFGGLASLAGVELGAGTEKEQAIAILNSRRFAMDFISDKNLMPVLFAEDWDADSQEWIEPDADEQPSDGDAFRIFDEEIRNVSVDRTSGLITLQVRWHDPVLAQQWANELVSRANELIRADAIDEANRSIEYLERELENTSVMELRRGLFQLIEQQISAVMLANVRDEYAFKVLDPAVASDMDDFEEPRRILLVIIGLFIGLILGVVAAFVSQFLSVRSQPEAQ